MPSFNRYYTPPGSAVPSSVSRDLNPGEYSWDTVVYQSGRPILDAELNLVQDASEYNRTLLAGKSLPSGFIRGQTTLSALNDYAFGVPPGVPVDSFVLPRLLATVAGMPVVVEYTGAVTPNANVVTLPAASASSGAPPDIKRTDFVFLEVWRAQVAPSPRAYGYVQIATAFTIAPGDTVTIDTTVLGGAPVTLTAVAGAPGVGQFQIGANADATGINFAAAVNNPANGLFPDVTANAHSSSIVQITAGTGGAVGNGVTLARVEAVPGSIVLSGGNLLNGANRPNKPTQNAIYRHGNVGSPSGVNLPDNLVDPALNVESTQRVQVQYRLRTYSSVAGGINPKTQPDGFSNANVLAQGATGAPVAGYPFVPADGVTVSGNSDAGAYGFVDNGLYIAGEGDPASAAALGTADGFVYAIPVCFVFRRNDASGTGGFNPTSNANGALSVAHAGFNNAHLETPGPVLINAGQSDRPDGAFHDVIVAADVLDLRRHVTPPGYDFGSELKYQTQSLLDATNLTWQVESSDLGTMGTGSGGQSTTPMVCDEIARPTDPLSNVLGDRIRTFDHIARRFGSQPVVERVIFEVLPNAGAYPVGFAVTNSGPGWCEDDTISLDFTALDASTEQSWLLPSAVRPVTGSWPAGTKVTDVLVSYHDDGHSLVPVDQTIQFKNVTGVGTTTVVVTLDRNPQVVDAGAGTVLVDVLGGASGSQRRIFLELEVTYPTGAGLIRTPRAPLTPSAVSGYAPYNGGAIVQYDPSQRPSDMVLTWVPQPKFRPPFREVLLEQQTKNVLDTIVTRNASTVYPPWRISTTVGMTANGAAPVNVTVGSSERKVVLGAVAPGVQVPVAVSYLPQDPIADFGAVGYRLDVYYQGTSPQTCGVQPGAVPTNLLPHGFTVEPIAVSNHVWTGQTGAGSVELAFPYAVPLDPIPMANLIPGGDLEWYFAATATVAVSDFDAATGSLTLHPMVPMDASAPLTLGDPANGTQIDGEFRAYYDFVNAGGYKSTVMAQPLSGAARHKVFTTMLARPTTATLLFRPGELILLVFSRWAVLDADNKVVVADPPVGTPSSTVAVFRTKNLLLTAGT
jgi:hypothetical protein